MSSPWSSAVALRIEEICSRFEAAWNEGQRPRIEDYFAEVAESERSELLPELLALDLEYRRKAGEGPALAEYLGRFPGQDELVRASFGITIQSAAGPRMKETAGGSRQVAGPRYRIIRPHARGGLGQVSVARDEQLCREVALKEIRPERGDDPQLRRRFLAEAEITGQLQHPGVVPVYALEEGSDGRPYYAMRFVEGKTLAEAIAQYHLLPTLLAFCGLLQRFVAVCQTVAYAHSKGVIHRDLKPANVMVGDYGETLVVDWGLAKRLGESALGRATGESTGDSPSTGSPAESEPRTLVYGPRGAGGITEDGQVLGTPAYMAPEVAAARVEEVGPAADVYGLGAMLYELLTDQAPYRGQGAEEVMRQVRQGPPPSPSRLRSSVPRALEAVCLKAMARASADRYAGAADMAAEVDRWLADEPVAAYREPVLVRLGRWRRRHKALVNALAAAVIVAGLFAGLAWRQKAQRVAQVERDAGAALAEATALGKRAAGLTEQPAQWQSTLAAALSAVKLAESLLSKEEDGVDAKLQDHVQEVRAGLEADERDRRLVARFEEVRLEQTEVDVERSMFKGYNAYPKLCAALRAYGLKIGQTPIEQALARLRKRPMAVQKHVVAALDLCLRTATGVSWRERQWLVGVVVAADTDPWRQQMRTALRSRNRKAAEQLLRQFEPGEHSPAFLFLVADGLPRTAEALRLRVLQRNQQAHPGDFWANNMLGSALAHASVPRWDEAIRYYTAALALRPENPGVYVNLAGALSERGYLTDAIAAGRKAIALSPNYATARYNLGTDLLKQGHLGEAIAAFREAIRLKKDYAEAHTHLGFAFQEKGWLDEAVAAHREAIRLKKDLPQAHTNLGLALLAKGQLEEGIAAHREAIRLRKNYAVAHNNLGLALSSKGQMAEAIGEFRKAVGFKKDFAEAHCNLGLALWAQGQLGPALASLRRGHECGSRNPRWPYPSVEWIQECEQVVQLERKLLAILGREPQPKKAEEKTQLALLCLKYKRFYAAAARFYREAFAADPALAENFNRGHRYNAARSAALAGCGKGEDVAKLTPEEKAELRRQARSWLRAELARWANFLNAGKPKARTDVEQHLRYWQRDPYLNGVREPAALGKLPEAERKEWAKLWADVAALLAQAARKK
jgi:serine/threonine-protein kinase